MTKRKSPDTEEKTTTTTTTTATAAASAVTACGKLHCCLSERDWCEIHLIPDYGLDRHDGDSNKHHAWYQTQDDCFCHKSANKCHWKKVMAQCMSTCCTFLFPNDKNKKGKACIHFGKTDLTLHEGCGQGEKNECGVPRKCVEFLDSLQTCAPDEVRMRMINRKFLECVSQDEWPFMATDPTNILQALAIAREKLKK